MLAVIVDISDMESNRHCYMSADKYNELVMKVTRDL